MSGKSYFAVTGIVFLVIAFFHLLRIIFGWSPVVEGWAVPMWLSWAALVLAGWLGSEGLRLARKPE